MERLIEELNHPTGIACSGLIVNELGILRLTTGSVVEKAETEKVLRTLMNTCKGSDRFVAFSFLATLDDPEEETRTSLVQFRANGANEGMLAFAESHVEAFKKKLSQSSGKSECTTCGSIEDMQSVTGRCPGCGRSHAK